MEYAINSINGKKVIASDLTITRGPYYVCPICRSPVFLRRGSGKVPHFAHNSKQAKLDCELYISLGVEAHSQNYQKEREAPYRTLGLYIRLANEHSLTFKWSLEISIPEPDVNIGTVRLPFALGGQRNIPASTIKSGGLRVPISPRVGPFSLVLDNIPEGRWRNRISQPILGLSTINLNVFRYSPFGGKLLNDEGSLYWGRSYVLLWTINSKPKWFPSKNVVHTVPLKDYMAWEGVYLRLPEKYNQQVEKWVSENTGRSVLQPPAEVELINPFPEYRLPDGSYVIQNDNTVTLGIIGKGGASKWKVVNCYNAKTGVTKKLKGDGRVPTVVQLHLDAGRNDIWLDDHIEGNQQIIVDVNASYPLNISGVKLFAIDNKSLEEYEVFLYNNEAIELVKRAYEGNVTFTKVYIPAYVKIRLNWLDANNEEQSLYMATIEVQENKEPTDFEEKMLELLNSLSNLNKGYFSIDAGVFGRLKVEPTKKQSDSSNLILDLGDKWRERAYNLLNLSSSRTNARYTIIYKKIELSIFSEIDQKILRKIISRRKWPVDLAPYCWNLLNEVQKVISINRVRYGGN